MKCLHREFFVYIMKTSELRIGNYVKGALGELCVVTQISSSINSELVGYKEIHNLMSWGQNGQQPIPLTEEWLLKLGFLGKELITDNLIFVKLSNSIYVKGMSGAIHAKSVEYVHQLQNLYFALTGEELTLKQ
jgi:hypothetical protein